MIGFVWVESNLRQVDLSRHAPHGIICQFWFPYYFLSEVEGFALNPLSEKGKGGSLAGGFWSGWPRGQPKDCTLYNGPMLKEVTHSPMAGAIVDLFGALWGKVGSIVTRPVGMQVRVENGWVTRAVLAPTAQGIRREFSQLFANSGTSVGQDGNWQDFSENKQVITGKLGGITVHARNIGIESAGKGQFTSAKWDNTVKETIV